MLKDDLMTKKEYEKKMEELFNKAWYNGYKDWIFEKIQKHLWDDTMYQECSSVINPFIMDNSMDVIQKMDVSFKYKFLRSKLWNEGFNLKIDIDSRFYIGLKKDSDTYNDCLFYSMPVISEHQISYKEMIILMTATNKTAEEIIDFYDLNSFENVLKMIKKTGLISPEKTESKKKKKSKSKNLNSKNYDNYKPTQLGNTDTIVPKEYLTTTTSINNDYSITLNNANTTVIDEAINCAPNEVKEMINEIRNQESDGE